MHTNAYICMFLYVKLTGLYTHTHMPMHYILFVLRIILNIWDC